MALKDSDIREHNNPNLSHVDSNFVRGGRRVVADLTELYALATVDPSLGVSKVDQLKENATRVYVISEDKDYKLVDIADITAGVFNPTAWLLDTIDESNLVHRTGDESIGGVKTFTDDLFVQNVRTSNGITQSQFDNLALNFSNSNNTTIFENGKFRFQKGGFESYLSFIDPTANRTLLLPDVSGTLALDGNVVHVTGNENISDVKTFNAVTNGDSIVVQEIGNTNKKTRFQGGGLLMTGGSDFPTYSSNLSATQLVLTNSGSGSSTSIIPNGITTPYVNVKTEGGSFAGTIQTPTLTGNRSYTLPDATGDIPLKTSFSANGPLNYSSSTGVFSMTQASASVPGWLSSADFTRFYNYDIQGIYNNSGNTNPHIITTMVSGTSFTIRRGTSSDTDNLFRLQNGAGTTTFVVKGNGSTTASDLTLSTAPTTSAGTYDFITRNTSTGVIEKIASSSLAVDSNVVHTSGDESIGGNKTFTDDIISTGGNYITAWTADNTSSTHIHGTNVSVADSDNNYVTIHTDDIEFRTTGNYIGKLVSGSTTTGAGHTWTLPNATGILATTLTTTSSLDFPNTGASTHSDLTVTLTGAALGDVVMVGIPHGSVMPNSCYTAWVSATDTVTVRFSNYDSTVSSNPSSGTFRISIIKY